MWKRPPLGGLFFCQFLPRQFFGQFIDPLLGLLYQCLNPGIVGYRQLEGDETIGIGGRLLLAFQWRLGCVPLAPSSMTIPVDIQHAEVFSPDLSLGDKGLVDQERAHVADSVPGLEDEVDGGAGSGDCLIFSKIIIGQEHDDIGSLP